MQCLHESQVYSTPSALAYPYGWSRLGADHRAGLEQTGLIDGFTASMAVWFTDSLYIVVLGNIESGQWSRWSSDLAAQARGEPVTIASARREIALDTAVARRLVGRFANAEHTLDIERRSNSLWLTLDGWSVPKYLSPVSATEFELRSDIGRIAFELGDNGPSRALVWVFSPTERISYTRVKETKH